MQIDAMIEACASPSLAVVILWRDHIPFKRYKHRCAVPRHAFNAFRSAVQLHKAFCQWQPQPCPFVFSRQRTVDLAERLKHAIDMFLGDTDAVVGYRYRQPPVICQPIDW